jgi:anaerobic magnesium-protoporphyrin IX monomethyl ester cyclase
VKRIVLVNPPYSFWSSEKQYLRPLIGTMPSLGLLGLAAVLRQKGYLVKIVESASLGLSISKTLGHILKEKPDYVGITCTTVSVEHAGTIAQSVKEADPGILLFVGGPHVTALPGETFRRYPSFDYGVLGEGERAFAELLEAVEGKADLKKVPSAVFREGPEVTVNPRRKFIENLDRLPFPAFDLLPSFPRKYRPPLLNYLRGPAASLITSRGCPEVCTFCDRSVFGNRYRHFSEGYLGDLIGHLRAKYGIRHFIFADDQFTASRTRLVRFCEKLLKENIKIRWNCDARVDSVDSMMLQLMRRAGCWMISYGIESGSQEILDRVQKGIRLEQAEETVHRTREAGIRTKGLFMIGYPEETAQTLAQTLRFMLHGPFNEVNLSILTPYPGTAIYAAIRKDPSFVEDWGRMNALHLLYTPKNISQAALQEAYRRILCKFYMRPGITFSYLGLLLRSPENCARLLASLGLRLYTLLKSPAAP